MKTSDLLAWVALVWSVLVWLSLSAVVVLAGGLFSLTDRLNGSHVSAVVSIDAVLFVLEAALAVCIFKRSKPWALPTMTVWLAVVGFAVSMGDLRALPICLMWVLIFMAPVCFLIGALILERGKGQAS